MDERRNLHVRLSAVAYDAIREFCDDQGVSVTAVVEALGRLLVGGTTATPDEIVDAARRIDRQHRSRRD